MSKKNKKGNLQKGNKLALFLVLICLFGLTLIVFLCLSGEKGTVHTPLAYAIGTNIAVVSAMDGFVSDIYVKDYQKVLKGQPLVKLNDEFLVYQIDSLTAQLSLLETKIARKDQGVAFSKSKLDSYSKRLESEKLELENCKRQSKLFGELAKKNAVSKNYFYNIYYKELTTNQKLLSTEAELMGQNAEIMKANDEKEIAKYEYEIAKKAMDELKYSLSLTTVKSPDDGYLETINVIKNQYLSKGGQITRIDVVEKGHTGVMALFTEEQIQYINVGQAVSVRFYLAPTKSFKGTIVDIAKSTINTAYGNDTDNIIPLWDVNRSQITRSKKYIGVYVDIPENAVVDNMMVVEGMSASVTVYR